MSSTNDPGILANQVSISLDVPKPSDPGFQETLSLYLKRMADSINSKEGATYLLQELATFKQFYTSGNPQITRNVYRTTFDVVNLNGGSIAGGATVTVPHNIVGILETALIYADCTTAEPRYFTVVYPNAQLVGNNLVFVNPLAGTAITRCTFVAEYLKN
jgi:hypothetical protein